MRTLRCFGFGAAALGATFTHASIFVDFGSQLTTDPGWTNVTGNGIYTGLTDGSISADLEISGVTGTYTYGRADLKPVVPGYPDTATIDNLFAPWDTGVISITLSGLQAGGTYDLAILASQQRSYGVDSKAADYTLSNGATSETIHIAAANNSSLSFFSTIAASEAGQLFLTVAHGENDKIVINTLEIVGAGISAVPEPSALGALAGGLALLVGFGRRRRG